MLKIKRNEAKRTCRLLAASAVVSAIAMTALAQSVDELVTYRPDNRAGSADAAAVIAEMIADRSQSAAVRDRARSMAPEGAFAVGAEELLIDIGAHDFLAGGVVPVALPANLPEPSVGPDATAATAVAPNRTQRSSGQNWTSGVGLSSAINDRGGDGGGGLGGGGDGASASSSGGGDSGGGGGDSGGGGGDSGGGGGESGGGGGGSGGSGGGDASGGDSGGGGGGSGGGGDSGGGDSGGGDSGGGDSGGGDSGGGDSGGGDSGGGGGGGWN